MHVRGIDTCSYAVPLVAWLKLRYVPANRFDLAGHINA
jgi:hypothetical protein